MHTSSTPRKGTALHRWAIAAAIGLAPLTCLADLIVLIDTSRSSPVMDPKLGAVFAAGVMPTITKRVSRMQLGEQLIVFFVDDARRVDAAVLSRTIQRAPTATGDTAAAYARVLPQFVAQKVEQRRQGPAMGQSHLTAGIVAARGLVQPGKACDIVYVTDGVESGSGGWNSPRDLHKPLPPNPKLNLKGCTVSLYGVGQRLIPKEAQAVAAHWEVWLKAAGASDVRLQKF